jgi:hypothetical protein
VIAKAESGYQPPTEDVFDAIMAKCHVTERERKIFLGMLVLARAVRGPAPQFFPEVPGTGTGSGVPAAVVSGDRVRAVPGLRVRARHEHPRRIR